MSFRKAASTLAGGMLIFACACHGQDAKAQPTFDAASLKIADVKRSAPQMKGGPGTSDPGLFTGTRLPLMFLLGQAWDIKELNRIVGPSWLMSPEKLFSVTATMPPQTTRQQFQLMLQNLLVERFKIKFHRETKTVPGYDLVVVPGGPKLNLSAEQDAPDATPPTGKLDEDGFLVLSPGHGHGIAMGRGGTHAKFQNCEIDEFVTPFLSSFIGQATGETGFHVVNKTGLGGKYDFTLKFDSVLDSSTIVVPPRRANTQPEVGSSAESASDPSGLPKLFGAMEQQLGLRLVKVKGVPLDVLVIDRLETVPIEN